jgi:hypothetical protein
VIQEVVAQATPGTGASALEAWRAIAILAITGLTTILGIIAKAALAQRKVPPPAPTNGSTPRHSWQEERGEFSLRLETVEDEASRQRDFRHDTYAKQMQEVMGRVSKLEAWKEFLEANKQ